MNDFCNPPKDRELLTITYKNDMIFKIKSAALKPSAYVEVGRVANMITLFPDMAVHVEVGLDTNTLETNGDLSHRRVQAVKDALLRAGIEARRIRTTVDRAAPTLGSENTLSVKVVDRVVRVFRPATNTRQNGSQIGYQAC